ncbi:MAG: adenylosuccinate lyase [Lentisphaerae bacterium]|nr:adenylosuccinate lyase [Lentisphaerota bacterium]
MANYNVLSERYATEKINGIFSEHGKTVAERDLWVAVMRAQNRLGVAIPPADIEKFAAARGKVDLALIKAIERKTRHDVKAKIEAFVQAAGAGEHVHKGMTSRDLTDNVEQMQIRQAARVIFGKYVSVLRHLLGRAGEYGGVALTARTHHQPAQVTTLGRRFAMWAEELHGHLLSFERFIEAYPLRGIKGPVGTQFDMLTLLGSEAKVAELEKRVAAELGFAAVLDSTGQVYPRSLDYELVSHLALLASAAENFAKGMRLMSGYELVTEGFKDGQVGSSAMPHKMNTRSSERICGFAELLKMYADGASRLAGDQWEEGDVSCSVQRRVIVPDAFYASDGLCETALTVLNEMGAYPAVIDRETDRYLPFLATTEILMLAVRSGVGREAAHAAIKKHAVSEALRLRGGADDDAVRLADRLAEDPAFMAAGITSEAIAAVLSDKAHFAGRAAAQIAAVCSKCGSLLAKYAADAAYEPGGIL